MNEGDFGKLLKEHKECLFDEKKFRAILSDVFPNDIQMNNILVNLFHLGLPRDIEDLGKDINNTFISRYKKKAVDTNGLDQKLAENGIRLWVYGYGVAVLKREIDIFQNDSNDESLDQNGIGEKVKGFSNCSFKITLPKLVLLDEVVKASFKILSKTGIKVDVVLDEIYISDKLNNKYDQYYNNIFKRKGSIQKEISVDICIIKNHFFIPDSVLTMYFLTGEGYKYEICYSFKKEKAVPEYVMKREMNDEEEQRFEGIIRNEGPIINPVIAPIKNPPIPQIDEYKKAVLREKYYIQNEGGRRYSVTNGNLIANKNGLYTYSFEMEAELNLSDDTPVSLKVGAIESTGSVLVCEGFQIIVIVDKDFGPKVSQAFIVVEPWKLLEALASKLENIRSNNKIALEIIQDGPTLASKEDASMIPMGQKAAMNVMKKNDITVIWGPPGTGKTYTMAQIAKNALQNGKSVLVVSHSNVSVDGVVKQMVSVLKNEKKNDLLNDGKVLRYGYVRDYELSKEPDAVAYNYALDKRPDLKNQMEQLRINKEKLIHSGKHLSHEREQIEKDLKKLRGEVRSEERHYVEKASFVATTISKVIIDPLFNEASFDVVMFDEVSMAYVPQIVVAATYAREKMIMVGDFRQLPPIVQSEAKKVLEVDIFSYLGMVKESKVCAHPWLVMLNEQRRMHPSISAFSNKYIYNNLLVDHDSVQTNRTDVVSREPLAGYAINLVDLFGTYAASMKNSDNSRFNIISAIITFLTALEAEENGEDSIGIITPYAAQTRLIRAMIQDHRKIEDTDVACSTVHQFQGSERNLIIFDAVENYPATKVAWLMSKAMDSVTRLINVAVTRAKGKLIVVANTKFWDNRIDSYYHIFGKLLKYLSSSGKVISNSNKDLIPYIYELPSSKNMCHYPYIDEALDSFKTDVKKTREKIVISIPDGKLDEETQGIVLDTILQAKSDGITVLCKTNGYEDLPSGWKNITWASENAIFPLIILDDKVAWYGIPKSRGRFVDGNSSYNTVVQTIYRITGEHTIEIIKAFSEFEYRVVDDQKKPLLDKGKGEDGKKQAGLDKFVRQRERCPKCKNPMNLTRSKKGKVYLKCSSPKCKEIAYLLPEVVNAYIDIKHVTCPRHHCGITARVGEYGIYVKCDQGHYLKPDEI